MPLRLTNSPLGQEFHGFIVEIEIDERFTGIGVRSLAAQYDKVGVAQHSLESYILERRAALRRAVSKFHESERDGDFSGCDPLGGRQHGFDQRRFHPRNLGSEPRTLKSFVVDTEEA